MGTYATTTSLQDIMVGITFNTATTALANKAIPWAERYVNKYLSKRYDLSASTFQTSTSIPPLVTDLTEQISEGFIYWRNSRGGKESISRGMGMIKHATECLNLIKDYEVDLMNTAGSLVTELEQTAYQVLSTTDGYVETFAEDSDLTWEVDENKLNDIDTDRTSQ